MLPLSHDSYFYLGRHRSCEDRWTLVRLMSRILSESDVERVYSYLSDLTRAFAFMIVHKIAVLSVVLSSLIPIKLKAASSPVQAFYANALKKGIEDCKNHEIKLGMLSLRMAELGSSSDQQWSQAKFLSLLCSSEAEILKSFYSEINSLDSSKLSFFSTKAPFI